MYDVLFLVDIHIKNSKMDFFFRLFGNVFEGFKPFEDYDTGKARYDKYSLMKAIQGYTLYDK